MRTRSFLALALVATASLAGCGSSDDAQMGDGAADVRSDAAEEDAGSRNDGSISPDAADAAHASDGPDASEAGAKKDGATGDAADGGPYPAFPVDYPQIVKNKGVIMASPVIVTISFPGDTDAPTWEDFGDGIGASSYWSAATTQYGVGPATSGAKNHVRMTNPLPKSIGYIQLQKFVTAVLTAAEADAGAPGGKDGGAPDPAWPKPTFDKAGNTQTIYSLFIPSDTAVTDPGTGKSFCNEGGLGYHGNVKVNGATLLYAVNLECGLPTASTEETAAHEYVESATDPTQKGYTGFDATHLAWELYSGFQAELADACQYWADSYYQDTGSFPYWIQTIWSNAAAPTGHNPCVPAQPGVYHGMTLFPASVPTVTVDLTAIGLGAANPTEGFNVKIGTPLNFQVGYFSDGPDAPWTIGYNFPAETGLYTTTSYTPLSNGTATVHIDTPSGSNGDKATVTVDVTAKGQGGFHLMAITWDPPTGGGYQPHYLPIVLVDQ